MSKKISKLKMIFEDNSLSDLQKYNKIRKFQNKGLGVCKFVIALNIIIFPILFISPKVKLNNQNLSPIIAFENLSYTK